MDVLEMVNLIESLGFDNNDKMKLVSVLLSATSGTRSVVESLKYFEEWFNNFGEKG